MRKATPELTEEVRRLYSESGSYPKMIKDLELPCKYMPVFSRIVNGAIYVSWQMENNIREKIGWEALPAENKIINLSELKAIKRVGDPRPYRTSLQISDKEVAEAIRREAKRQGITITEYLANLIHLTTTAAP